MTCHAGGAISTTIASSEPYSTGQTGYFKELCFSIGEYNFTIYGSGDLAAWAEEIVLSQQTRLRLLREEEILAQVRVPHSLSLLIKWWSPNLNLVL